MKLAVQFPNTQTQPDEQLTLHAITRSQSSPTFKFMTAELQHQNVKLATIQTIQLCAVNENLLIRINFSKLN